MASGGCRSKLRVTRNRSRSRPQRVRLEDLRVLTQRLLDDIVQPDRLARHPQRPQFLAPPELLRQPFERLQHAHAQLPPLMSHLRSS